MAILGTIEFVKQSAAGVPVDELLAELPAPVQETYRRRILAGSWYPYEAYTSLLAGVTRRLGSGRPDFPASLGRFAAQQDVGTIFKIVSA